jgi:hypothetical protein
LPEVAFGETPSGNSHSPQTPYLGNWTEWVTPAVSKEPNEYILRTILLTRLNLSRQVNRLNTGTRAMFTSQAVMQKTNYPEEDLVLQAKAGSHPAFEALYRMHLERVYGICMRILSDRRRQY